MPTWDIRFDLPLDLNDGRLLQALARAEALAQVIRGIRISPYVETRLNQLNIVRAVQGTTAIEGANLSEEDVERVLDSLAPVLPISRQREEQEARNAEAAMRYIAEILRQEPDRPLTESLICRLNELITDQIDYPDHVPGAYRSHGVTAGTYVPPRSLEEIRLHMQAFVTWLNEAVSKSLHPIARALAAHFYFVSIHPFGEGNGRTARAIESYLLYQAGINFFGFYSLANFYYRHRVTYIEKLDEVRFQAHSLTPFVSFAVDGLVEELNTIHGEVLDYLAILTYRDFAYETLNRAQLSSKTRERLSRFIGILGSEAVPLRLLRAGGHQLSALYKGASIRTLERDLDQLEKLGLILREAGVVRARTEALERVT